MNTKKMTLMNLIVVMMVLFSFGFTSYDGSNAGEFIRDNDPDITEEDPPIDPEGDQETPLQEAIKKVLITREAEGLPTPSSVKTQLQAESLQPDGVPGAESLSKTVITSTTVIDFDHPQEAGYEKWPDFIVKDELPANAVGSVEPGDYTQAVHDTLESALPGIWGQYSYGYEPRRFTVTETYTINYPEPSIQNDEMSILGVPSSITADQFVMGFTYSGPNIDYTINPKWEVCFLGACYTIAEVKAGFALDWALGLRLPVELELNLPDVMVEGCSYFPDTTLYALDWDAEQFQSAGLSRYENGYEYLLKYEFFIGAKVVILEQTVLKWAIETEYDASKSFQTPIGPDHAFELGELYLPPELTGLRFALNVEGMPIGTIGLGLGIIPKLGSDKITASWQALPGSDASGSGDLSYKRADTPVTLGPITADDLSPIDYAQIQLSEFRYWLTQFLIKLTSRIEVDLFGFGKVKSPPITIIDAIDLSGLGFTKDLWVGTHKGTSNALVAKVPVIPPIEAGTDQSLYEGSVLSLGPVKFLTCSNEVPITTSIDWGDGSPLESGTVGRIESVGTIFGSHSYPDDGKYPVQVCVSDGAGWKACDSYQVTVLNFPPSVDAGPDQSIMEGETVTLNASTFTDDGILDTHQATIDWGDGSSPESGAITENMGSGSVSGTHSYGDNGNFQVTVTVCDDDGGCGTDQFQVTVENLSPEVNLDKAAAFHFPRGEAFLSHKGLEQIYHATATDPGSDDLEFHWSFGTTNKYYNNDVSADPSISPDGIFPFQATDSAGAIFETPGIHDIGIEVTDDDLGVSSDRIPVIVIDNGGVPQGRMFWLKQFSGAGSSQIDSNELQAYLSITNFASKYFSEIREVKSLEEARDILAPNYSSLRNTVEAYLLVAWLNFAQGAIGWDEQMDTNRDCAADISFYKALHDVEEVLINMSASPMDLLQAKNLIDPFILGRKNMNQICSPNPIRILPKWILPMPWGRSK
jgi:hypothetical protein